MKEMIKAIVASVGLIIGGFFVLMLLSCWTINNHNQTQYDRFRGMSDNADGPIAPCESVDLFSGETVGGAFFLIGFFSFLMGSSIVLFGSNIFSGYPVVRTCLVIWAYFWLVVITIGIMMKILDKIDKH